MRVLESVDIILNPDIDGDVGGVDIEKESGRDQDQERTKKLARDHMSVDKQRGKVDEEEESGGDN